MVSAYPQLGLLLSSALRRLTDLHPDMTVMQVLFLMHVAAHPGTTQRDCYQTLQLADGTASRITAMLGEFGRGNVAGLGLVEMRVDPNDRRNRNLFLTAKGSRLMASIAKDLKLTSA